MRAKLLVALPLASVLLACAGDTDTVPPAAGGGGKAGTSAGGSAGKAGGGGGAAGKAGAGGNTTAGAAGTPGAGAAGSTSAGSAGTTTAGTAGTAGTASGGSAGSAGGGAAGQPTGGQGGQAGKAGSAGQTGGGQAGTGQGGAGANGGSAGAGGAAFCDASICQGTCLITGCCAEANVCGDVCCGSGQACLFGACVTPGAACQSAGDCGDGNYCETALGANGTGGGGGSGGGAAGAAGSAGGGPVCSQSLPENGRCLPKAVVCTSPGVPAGCVEACEFKPQPGKLDAVKKWQWGPVAKDYPLRTDVWSSPVVGRIVDANCDDKVDELDPPNVVFVSGRSFTEATTLGTCCHCNGTTPTACHTGALRVLDGRSGTELFSIFQAFPDSVGVAGVSPALGDIDGDGATDIVAVTGEGTVVVLDRRGQLIGKADKPFPNATVDIFGWGGGIALGDMDGDGHPEIALGSTLYSTKTMKQSGVVTLVFTGDEGTGANNALVAAATPLSYFADLDGNGQLELVAGKTAYRLDGSKLWSRADVTDGFTAVADFDRDGAPELVHVANGTLTLLNAATGASLAPAFTLPGAGSGGPPTVADFNGDGRPDVGVAQQNKYSVSKIAKSPVGWTIDTVWAVENHDLSSSVTGSSVFDFEGDGRAEVIYADECFLWVYDGATGDVRFATPTTSFTGTESSIVADVDGDGHAELVWLANGADPSAAGWRCDIAPWNMPDPAKNRPAWVPGPATGGGYRGLAVFGDRNNSWVGTRTLWNQHAYSVTNVCDERDSACTPDASYGEIPMSQKDNWKLPWLDNFRQNVQDKGLFDAPDAIVSVSATCATPVVAAVSLRNAGLAPLPAGVEVELVRGAGGFLLETFTTTSPLGAGQTVTFTKSVPPSEAGKTDSYFARVPTGQKFRECRENNNQSAPVEPSCKD